MMFTYLIEPNQFDLWKVSVYQDKFEIAGAVFENTDEGYSDACDFAEEMISSLSS